MMCMMFAIKFKVKIVSSALNMVGYIHVSKICKLSREKNISKSLSQL